jgi:hypothetical protein
MTRSEAPSDLITAQQACALLEVAPDRNAVMVDEGLLTPTDVAGEPGFPRAEVIARRELGG